MARDEPKRDEPKPEEPQSDRALNPFFAVKPDHPAERYFSLWTITDEGRRNPAKVQAALELASRGLVELQGTCRLYVTMGGPADLVGMARGSLDEQAMLALQTAIQATGVLKTVFFKAFEFTQTSYAEHTKQIGQFGQP